MDHIIIEDRGQIIFTAGKNSTYNSLLLNTVQAMSHVAERFYEDVFVKFYVGHISISWFKTVKNVSFIIVCRDGSEEKYFEEVYRIYSRSVLFREVGLLDGLIREMMDK